MNTREAKQMASLIEELDRYKKTAIRAWAVFDQKDGKLLALGGTDVDWAIDNPGKAARTALDYYYPDDLKYCIRRIDVVPIGPEIVEKD